MTALTDLRTAWVDATNSGSGDAEAEAAREYIVALEQQLPAETVTYDGFGAPIVHDCGGPT